MKRGNSAVPFSELGSSPAKAGPEPKVKDIVDHLDDEETVVGSVAYGKGTHKGHDDEDTRGKVKKGSSPRHVYNLKTLTDGQKKKLLKDPQYKEYSPDLPKIT